MVRIEYDCPTTGEYGEVTGYWGDQDATGKRAFHRPSGETMYLFDDEVLSEVPA